MSKFELKLSAFGKQRFAKTATELRPLANPRHRGISVAWVTTPAAAMVGLLLGWSLESSCDSAGKMVEQEQQNTLKKVIELPEYCFMDQSDAVQLPDFEYIIK